MEYKGIAYDSKNPSPFIEKAFEVPGEPKLSLSIGSYALVALVYSGGILGMVALTLSYFKEFNIACVILSIALVLGELTIFICVLLDYLWVRKLKKVRRSLSIEHPTLVHRAVMRARSTHDRLNREYSSYKTSREKREAREFLTR